GNGPGTLYRVLVSTAPDPLSPGGASVTSSDTYNVFLATSGLFANTDYYFRAAAVNNNGLMTGYTAPVSERTLGSGEIGSPAGGSITEVNVTSVSAVWSLVSGATGYTLAASLSPDNPPVSIYASSTTAGQYSGAALFEGPALVPNTVYYLFVRANGPGVSGAWFAYPPVSTLVEFAPAPSGFSEVGSGELTFNWSSNGNPGDTMYRVIVSTAPDPLDPGGAVVTTSDTYEVLFSSSGLEPNTTYYFRAAGLNRDGVATAYTAPRGTATLAGTPVFSGFTDVAAQNIRLEWSAAGNPDNTLYRVAVSTAPDPLDPGGAVSTSSETYNTYLSSSGLAADTRYYFRVAGVNRNGVATDYTVAQGTATLVNEPSSPGFTSVNSQSVRFDWSGNGNPGGTLYRVAVSTAPDPLDPGGAAATVSDTYDVYLTSSGLAADTTYYFKVAGINRDG
ncbi:MAG TPA: hypothetical protein PL037_08820, partial [Elusimicrobiales bacterium]|nr:hypothetical protein [Elusimicrobiales bacterium]